VGNAWCCGTASERGGGRTGLCCRVWLGLASRYSSRRLSNLSRVGLCGWSCSWPWCGDGSNGPLNAGCGRGDLCRSCGCLTTGGRRGFGCCLGGDIRSGRRPRSAIWNRSWRLRHGWLNIGSRLTPLGLSGLFTRYVRHCFRNGAGRLGACCRLFLRSCIGGTEFIRLRALSLGGVLGGSDL
jgi:hypothetical protein